MNLAFGVTREQLNEWKRQASAGRIAFLTHYWLHPSFPGVTSVTKVGCANIDRLRAWAISHNLPPQYIHYRDRYPHYDIFGELQELILRREGQWEQLNKFVTKQPYTREDGAASSQDSAASVVKDRFDAPSSLMNGGRERK